MVRRSRTPQGVRGLKRVTKELADKLEGRTPQGVRGLKLYSDGKKLNSLWSHSARSAWIETFLPRRTVWRGGVALRKECVD